MNDRRAARPDLSDLFGGHPDTLSLLPPRGKLHRSFEWSSLMKSNVISPPPMIEVLHRTDAVVYKVWVAIERIATRWDGEELYEDVGLPDPIGVFDSLEEAQEHLRSLPGWYPEGSDHA
jgi:hypothetical protein